MATTEMTLDQAAVQEFAAGVRGPVLSPGDDGYDDARAIWNGLIDRRPAIIVQPTGAADVVDAVNFAREHRLTLSIKGGGHNVAGNAVNDGGLVIDLSHMRGVHVDPSTQRVRAQGGATWGDADRETQLFGLAVPGGVVSTTGIAGLTLHGGMGHLRRKHGLSIDSLLSVDIVTADGELRRASATENEDLFWAVRGAGSNFGVVTSFEFQAHPVGPMVMVGAIFYPLEDMKTLLPAWRDYMAAAPEELSSLALLLERPRGGAVPARASRRARLRGRRHVQRLARRRRAGRAAAARARRAADRPERALAVARPAERLRRAVPEGRVLLLEVARARRALGGCDRRDRGLRRAPSVAAHGHRDLASGRGNERASASRTPRTAAGRRRSSSPGR